MSVRVRLTRVGSKKNPMWRVVVADQRSPRDGRIIESIGHYNPQTQPSTIVIDRERLQHWIELGAQPTNTVRKLMRAPDTVAQAEVTQEAVAPEPAAPGEPETEPDEAAAEASTEEGEAGTVPSPEAEGDAEPPAEGDTAPDGTAGPESDAGPSGAAVEPSGDDAPAAEAQPPDAEPGADS